MFSGECDGHREGVGEEKARHKPSILYDHFLGLKKVPYLTHSHTGMDFIFKSVRQGFGDTSKLTVAISNRKD